MLVLPRAVAKRVERGIGQDALCGTRIHDVRGSVITRDKGAMDCSCGGGLTGFSWLGIGALDAERVVTEFTQEKSREHLGNRPTNVRIAVDKQHSPLRIDVVAEVESDIAHCRRCLPRRMSPGAASTPLRQRGLHAKTKNGTRQRSWVAPGRSLPGASPVVTYAVGVLPAARCDQVFPSPDLLEVLTNARPSPLAMRRRQMPSSVSVSTGCGSARSGRCSATPAAAMRMTLATSSTSSKSSASVRDAVPVRRSRSSREQ